MSSSVIPQYVSVSFHTGFRVFRTILVFNLLACKIKSREEHSCHIRRSGWMCADLLLCRSEILPEQL